MWISVKRITRKQSLRQGPIEEVDICVPKGQHYHELDHILCNSRAITDVGVVASFNTRSDHRLLRARLHFDLGEVRLTKVRSRRSRTTVMDEEAVGMLVEEDAFGMLGDINEDYTLLIDTISAIASRCRKIASNHATRRILDSTRALLGKRRHLDRKAYYVEYTILSKLCKRELAKDHPNFTTSRLLSGAENRKSLKKTKRALAEHRPDIPCLKFPDGWRCSSRPGMENIISAFFSDLFKSSLHSSTEVLRPGQEVPPFITSEVRHAIKTMPRGKAPGRDGITLELPQACGPTLSNALAKRFSRHITEYDVPVVWKQSPTYLPFKKGEKEDIANCRPITLLPVLYKVLRGAS